MTEPNYLIDSNVLKAAIAAAGSNPAQILQTSIDALEAARGTETLYVDASSPALSLFETSAVIGAASVDQHIAALRQVYPRLAQTPDELYGHMSYRDYINRFASPSTDPFMFFFPESTFKQRAVRPFGANYVMMTIPRNTTITVNKYVTFTMQYPVDIKYYDTQQLEVSYDTSIISPIEELTTNMIVSELVNMPNDQGRWIGFSVPAPQVSVRKIVSNVQAGRYFVSNYEFTDQYFMTRAWYRNIEDGPWIEMETTHAPTVYDPTTPTLQLKVIDNNLNVTLPLVYQNTNQVHGEIRVDIYTTKGSEIINLGDYQIEDFVMDMQPLDPIADVSVYTAAAQGVSFAIRSTAIMSGGKDELTFEQLKDRVINNSVGPQNIPITNVNFKSAAENRGFDLVANVDVVTNRIFMATRGLPKPSDQHLVTAATIGVSTLTTEDPTVIDHDWVKIHGKRTTFLSKNLYQSSNGILKLLPKAEVESIKAMESITKLRKVNTNQYLYSPFYYVLDTSSLELSVRAYELDRPEAKRLNFITQNPTIQLVVNTGTYSMQKVDTGYILQIQTKSGNFYKNLADNEVYAQIGARLPNSERYAYWLGQQVGTTADGERIFQFNIETTYDITEEHKLVLTNGRIDNVSVTPVEVDLTSTFDIFHVTTSLTDLYKPSPIDLLIGKFQLPAPCAAITRESITAVFGQTLGGLWTRGRTIPDTEVYEKYAIDVPLTYDTDQYGSPAFSIVDNQVVPNIIAHRGEVQKTATGEIIYAHLKNEIVMDNGKPVVSSTLVGGREFDLLTADGQYYFVDDEAYLDYKEEFTSILVDWITQDIPAIQAVALEKTKVYFYPKNQLASTTILVADYTEENISSAQSFALELYVSDGVYRSSEQRERIRNLTIRYLDTWVGGLEVSVSAAIDGLKDLYGDDVKSLTLSPLGGDKKIQYALISKEQSRMSLKRNLAVQQDGTYIIQEDVLIDFFKATPIGLN